MNLIVPLNRRIIVEPEKKEEITKGGIIIPETANQKAPTKGRVVSISEDCQIKGKIEVGDTVLFSKYSGTEVIIPAKDVEGKDRQYQVIKDEDILAVIKKQESANE